MKTIIEKNVPLAGHTTLGVGGNAEYFCEPEGEGSLKEALGFALDKGLRIYCLGGGSNVLVSDGGIKGLVIKLGKGFEKISEENGLVAFGSGVPFPKLVEYMCKKGYADLSCCAGIPGTAGGAVYMNAGIKEGSVSLFVDSVEICDPFSGELKPVPSKKMGFAYRRSILQDKNDIVTRVFLKKGIGDGTSWWREACEVIKKRATQQPYGEKSAGCFFKNPPGESAGALIDKAGLKGMSVGGAAVSAKHANFLINTGNASAKDIFELAETVRKRVGDRFGVDLEFEVRLLGFDNGEG